MKKVLVNFAEGQRFENLRRWNSFTAVSLGGFDEVLEYSMGDLDDEFLIANNTIFSEKKGLGVWLWKPYIIKDALNKIDEGDLLFYCDSSSVFYRSFNDVLPHLNFNRGIAIFNLPFIEAYWTSSEVLNFFDLNNDLRNTSQVCASFIAIKKGMEAERFVEEWLKHCQNPALMLCKESTDKRFIEHRYDQSILSCLSKSYGFNTNIDLSQYGRLPELYGRLHPTINDSRVSNYRPVILLTRRASIVRAALMYFYFTFYFKFIKR